MKTCNREKMKRRRKGRKRGRTQRWREEGDRQEGRIYRREKWTSRQKIA